MRAIVLFLVGVVGVLAPMARAQVDVSLAAVRVGVVDFDEAISFYVDHLDCSVAMDERDAGWVMLDSGGVPLVLTRSEEAVRLDPGRPNIHVTFHADDLEGRIARLRDGGVRPGPIEESQVGRHVPIRDPSGNMVHLEELKDASRRPERARVYNIGVSVSDMDGALAFYRDALGIGVMTEDYYPPVMVMNPGGATYFILHEGVEGRAPYTERSAWMGMALEVSDIDGAMVELRERGVRFLDEAPVRSGPVLMARFADPFGNRLELIQHVAADVGAGDEDEVVAPAATLEDLAWLTGTWRYETARGPWIETWGAPVGGAMTGMLRATRDGGTFLYELFTVEQRESEVRYFLRHFEPGLVPWASEADGPLTMPLIEAGEGRVVFGDAEKDWPQRLVYERVGEELVARLEGETRAGEERVLELRFRRVGG